MSATPAEAIATPPTMPGQPVPGLNILLMGPPGSGKTHAVRTLIDAGLEVFVLFTEPGMEILADTDPDQVHWHYVPPAQADWAAMIKNAVAVNTFDNKTLQAQAGLNKKDYAQFVDVLNVCQNFTCQRTNKDFGPVDDWGTDRVFVFDSLSGLNIMALDLAVGGKPIRTLPDWGVAMDNEERLINKFTLGTRCHFVLNAHIDRQTDEVMGGIQLVVAALGKKLGPTIPRFFSDCILTVRDGGTFTWATASSIADTKARNLPWKDNQPPTFVPLITNWRKHNE